MLSLINSVALQEEGHEIIQELAVLSIKFFSDE